MAPTSRTAPSVFARFLSLAILPLFIFFLSGPALAQTTATYHFHKEITTASSSGAYQLKTAGPDARAFAVRTTNLNGYATASAMIGAFETQGNVPNVPGIIPAGSAVTLHLYMRKTGTSGVLYPKAIIRAPSGAGNVLCSFTGTTALTTTITKYTLTATTTADVSMAAGDRFYLWVGVDVATAPNSNNYGELNLEGTLNGSYDSQLIVPLPNAPPSVNITSPTDNASFASPASVTINASASDSDGSVSKVEFFQGSTKLGEDATSPYSFTWNNPPPASFAYPLTARATDNVGLVGTSAPVNVFVSGGGAAGGSVASPPTPAAVNLTAEGASDWAHWGMGSPTAFNHKKDVTQKISNLALVNATGSSWLSDNPTTFTWTDGTPTAGATDTPTGVYVNGNVGNGLQFTVPADTNMRTLKVYAGLWCAQGKLEAFLSDGSGLAYVDTSLSNNAGTKNGVFTITYRAGSAGQTLTVRYTILNNYNAPYGNVTLEAATLSGGAPVLNAVSPASGVTGAQVTLTGENFGASQGTGAVTFNGVAATPSSWSSTSITAAVPAGATSGPVVVTTGGGSSAGAAFTVVPKIDGLTPASGLRGVSVTVSGTGFGPTQGTGTLTFNGAAASPTSWGANSIVAAVPQGATSGPVVVTVSGAASNGVDFNVVTTGTLSGSVTRTSDNGPLEGATVEALQSGVVKGTAVTSADGAYSMAGVEAGTYDLRVTAVGCQTAARNGVAIAAGGSRTENFLLENVGSLSGRVTQPDGVTAIPGATVKLRRGAAVVATATADASGEFSFTTLAGGNYTVEASAAGYLSATLPALVTGNTNTSVTVSLNVTNDGPVTYVYDELGRLISASTPTETATYVYDAVGNLLSIQRRSSALVSVTEFTPNGGAPGTPVVIYGTGFSAAAAENAVAFNGTAAAVTSATANEIRTSVPAGATTGVITVTTPAGSAASAAPFAVSTGGPPAVTDFTPAAGPVGTLVTVNGSNFETAATNNRVKVNQSLATVTSAAADSLVARIASGTGSGRISVATPSGSATSGADFYVTPPPYTGANVESAGRMTLNQSRTVSVTTADKIGMLIFDAAAGQNLSLQLAGGGTIAGGTVTVYRPDGVFLTSCAISASGNFIDATYIPLTGTYTIVVDPSSTNTGSLTLNLYEVAHVTGQIVAGGAPVPTTVSTPGQNVALTFSGTAGQRVSLGISGNTYGYVAWDRLDVWLRDPSGAVLGPSASLNGSGPNAFIDTVTLPLTGTYTISLDPPSMRTGSATFTLYDVVDVTGEITVGGPAVSKSNTVPGQNVRLAFQGAAGQKVSVVMSHAGISANYHILRPDGSTLAGPGGSFIDATTLPVAGTYTLLASPSGADTGTMTMTMYNVVDVTGPVAINGPSVPVPITTPGQNMSLTFQGTAGQKVSLTLTSNWFGFIWYGNTYVQLKAPDGTVLGQIDVNAGSQPLFLDATVLPVTGTYTITLDPSGTRQGGFDLWLKEVVDVTGAITADGVAVTKTTGQPGQNVLLTFQGSAGQVVSLSTSISGFSSWPRQYILRPDGTVLSGPANASLGPVTLPAAGTYTVKSDPGEMQTGTMTFTLTTAP